jgi:hypothetical protein
MAISIPASNSSVSINNNPCVVILSDWSQRPRQELMDRIEGIFRRPGEQALVPTVLIVDDLGSSLADHEGLLNDLTQAGGIVLEPYAQEEIETMRQHPLALLATQLAAIQAHWGVATALSPAVPSSPDAYKEFAKAVTRLSPGALLDVIEGHRTDDWRYST